MSRFVYLDESGTGNVQKEPHVVVAGVITSPDHDWKRLDIHLNAMASKYAPNRHPSEVVFHANDLLQGTGQWLHANYPTEVRRQVLRELCSIPAQFGLPLVTGYVDRAAAGVAAPHHTKSDLTLYCHVSAYVRCVVGIERFMRLGAEADEMAQIVHENTDHAKRHIKAMHQSLRTRAHEQFQNMREWPLSTFLPIERIADSTYFVDKADTKLLQVADAVAFAVRRHLAGKQDASSLVDLLRPQLVIDPKGEAF